MAFENIRTLMAVYGAVGTLLEALIAVGSLCLAVYCGRQAVRKHRTPYTPGLFWQYFAVLGVILLVPAFIFGQLALESVLEEVPANWLFAYITVFLIGGTVGGSELVSRYRDQPARAVTTVPAVFYVSLNAFGSIGALYLIYTYREKLGFPAEPAEWTSDVLVRAVLIAGFSSLVFFRTSVFKLRVGDADLAVGPSIVLDALLAAADRAVDRVMAEPRAKFVHQIMGGVSFEEPPSGARPPSRRQQRPARRPNRLSAYWLTACSWIVPDPRFPKRLSASCKRGSKRRSM